jgi:hypothetical protein
MGYSSLRQWLNPIHFAAQSSGFGKPFEGALLAPAASLVSLNASFPSRNDCRVLILGCGNSTFGEEMQRDGWTGPIVNGALTWKMYHGNFAWHSLLLDDTF